jgi:hypothetical protein
MERSIRGAAAALRLLRYPVRGRGATIAPSNGNAPLQEHA